MQNSRIKNPIQTNKKMFTQKDVNDMIRKRLERERISLIRRIGTKSKVSQG